MLRVSLLVASVAVALLMPSASGAANPKLLATVGPGFTISLTDAAGARVTHVDPGTYDVVVDDQSDEHDFHLSGPGVDRFTDVSFVGTTTWTVTLADGTYTFKCDPHASVLRGSFTVGSGASPSPPVATTPSPSPAGAAATTLRGVVGPGFTIKLTSAAGRMLKQLKAGRYDVAVSDRAANHDFHLKGPGVDRRTGVRFKGVVTWKVTLGKGTLTFFCDPHASTLRGSVRVT